MTPEQLLQKVSDMETILYKHKHQGAVDNTTPLPNPKTVHIKVFADDEIVSSGDGAFTFLIPTNYNKKYLTDCIAYVTDVSSSGDVVVQLYNITQGYDILVTPNKCTIDAGEFSSLTSASPTRIEGAYATIHAGDLIRIDVDSDGTDAYGLGVNLTYL